VVGHCDHGSWASQTRFLDWRPFSYFTLERRTTKWSPNAAPRLTETVELTPLDDGGTLVRFSMRAHSLPGRLMMKVVAGSLRRQFEKDFTLLAKVMAEDAGAVAAPVG
jgi:hypothetical protein